MSQTTHLTPVNHPKAWDAVAKLACDDIERLLEHFLSATDNLLYDLSKRANSNTEAAFYFDAMRELRINRHEASADLINKIRQQLTQLSEGNLPKQAPQHDLSLLSGDELERILACETAVNNVGTLYHSELTLLIRRMSGLCHLARIPEEQFPLSPSWLAHSFARSMPAINGKLAVIVFKHFEKHVLRQLDPILNQCNGLLVSDGYVSQESLSENSRIGIPRLNEIQTSLDEPSIPTATLGTNQFALPLHSLRQILANARFQAANDSNLGYRYAFNPGPVVPLNILGNTLTQQQHEIAGAPQLPLKNQVGDYISRALSGENPETPNALNPYHEDIIQLVEAFFDELLDDGELTTPTQALVCRLQIPVLKVALRNEKFFADSQHSARKYINTLTFIAQTLEFIELPEDDPLYAKLLNSVRRINKLFEFDEDIFSSELDTLQELEQHETKRSDIIEQRTIQAEEGRARFNRAKNAATECINHHIGEQKLQSETQDFIYEYWQQVLVLTFLREGNGSLWLAHGQTLNDLLWLDQEHTDDRTQARAESLRESLRERLITGLDALHLSPEQSLALAQKTLSATQKPPASRCPAPKAKNAIERQQERFNALEQEFFNIAKDMATGTWLKYQRDNEHLVCKLANKEPPENYLFVNRLGMKKFSISRKNLAEDLQQGRAQVLARTPLFDRIMNRALAHLKQSQ